MVIIMASEVKEIILKLNEIGTDVAVIKNDINHIKGKLECLEKENKKQNEEVEKIKERVNSLNLEIVKISAIVSIVALGIGAVVTTIVSKLLEMGGFK
jgi:predicted nuclease with TOPRIM domain